MSLDDLMHAVKEMADHDDPYHIAEATYDGRQGDLFGSTLLEAKLKKDSELYRLNLAKTAVNVVADRLEVAAVTVPDDPDSTAEIERVWAYNNLDLFADSWTRNACKLGDAYVFAWPVLDDGGNETGDVELAYHSARCMRIFYDPEHPTRKLFAIHRWTMTNGVKRVNLWYDDVFRRYSAQPKTKDEDAGSWKEFTGDDQEFELPNPYGEIPIFHFRTDAPYGVPEHRDAYGAQAAINKAFVTQTATMIAQGFPARYALQDAEAVLDAASDDPDWDDDTDTVSNTESVTGMGQGSKMRSAPGTLNWLTGVKNLVQFDGADPMKFLDPMGMYARMMSQTTDTPNYRLDFGGNMPSGELLKVANLPLNAKVGTRQKWMGATHQELWAFVLIKLLKRTLKDGAQVLVRWKPAATVQGKEDWEIADLKRGAGVPETQVLMEAGYAQDTVEGWQAGNRESMDLFRRAQILEQIGRGAGYFAQAVVAGIMDAKQVNKLMARVMDDATPPEDLNEDGGA